MLCHAGTVYFENERSFSLRRKLTGEDTLSLTFRLISFLSERFIEPSTYFQQNCLHQTSFIILSLTRCISRASTHTHIRTSLTSLSLFSINQSIKTADGDVRLLLQEETNFSITRACLGDKRLRKTQSDSW